MSSRLRLFTLAALPFALTACQTYEASYVETPSVRRTVVVERGYDPFDEPRTVYRERRVYREPAYDPYYEPRPRYEYGGGYRDRRYERDYVAPRPRVVPPAVVTGPVYRGGPGVVTGPVIGRPGQSDLPRGTYETQDGRRFVRPLQPGDLPPPTNYGRQSEQ